MRSKPLRKSSNIVSRRDSSLPNAVFRSQTKRGKPVKKDNTPGPGSYEIAGKLVHENHGTVHHSFHPKLIETNDQSSSSSNTPGPGHYAIQATQPEPTLISSSFFMSSNPRFSSFGRSAGDPTRYNPQLPSKRSFHLNVNNEWVV